MSHVTHFFLLLLLLLLLLRWWLYNIVFFTSIFFYKIRKLKIKCTHHTIKLSYTFVLFKSELLKINHFSLCSYIKSIISMHMYIRFIGSHAIIIYGVVWHCMYTYSVYTLYIRNWLYRITWMKWMWYASCMIHCCMIHYCMIHYCQNTNSNLQLWVPSVLF